MTRQRPLHKRLRDELFYRLVAGLFVLLRWLPRRTALGLMRGVGSLLFRLLGREREKTIRHLTLAFGGEKSTAEIRTLARRVFRHFAMAIGEFIRLPNLMAGEIDSIITGDSLEPLDALLAQGHGVIGLTGHFGNWEVLGAWLSRQGYPLRVVGTALEDPRLDRLVVATRNQAGYTNIARGRDTREVIRVLQRGEILGILMDQDTKVQGTFVRFFGRPTYTPTGPVILARKFDVPVIPVFLRMTEEYGYHVECGAPITMQKTADEAADLQVNTQRCSDAYEAIIRQYPEQWVWMHKRWKTRPQR